MLPARAARAARAGGSSATSAHAYTARSTWSKARSRRAIIIALSGSARRGWADAPKPRCSLSS
ncbi:hypothetical protein BE20_30340 [Sorangium cellulosum]|nr:hypothetical protein BE20_30340 [Sorangium cellulosum]